MDRRSLSSSKRVIQAYSDSPSAVVFSTRNQLSNRCKALRRLSMRMRRDRYRWKAAECWMRLSLLVSSCVPKSFWFALRPESPSGAEKWSSSSRRPEDEGNCSRGKVAIGNGYGSRPPGFDSKFSPGMGSGGPSSIAVYLMRSCAGDKRILRIHSNSVVPGSQARHKRMNKTQTPDRTMLARPRSVAQWLTLSSMIRTTLVDLRSTRVAV
eukprot:scaffold1312_cov393-Prasinococcus_capsulatus_cf.AAC.19